ncbi:MAG: GNAT family N-acetyltransferase [Acidobacteria bacterium]|nr:MAG: GNAT family N-acetyltransferase [Acidobacteriota bacterium]
MDQVVIRRAKLDDLEQLLMFEQAMIEAERPFDEKIRKGSDVRYYDLTALISSPEAEVVVAELNSELIATGYARLKLSEPYYAHDKYSYLGFMFVVPEHRGKGVNRMIIDALESWSRSKGVSVIELEVFAENSSAVKAYEKSNYKGLMLTMRKSL